MEPPLTAAAIVQARMGSSRLPGKVLKPLGGKTVLHHVLNRCAAIAGIDMIICAVPDERASEPIEVVASECNAKVFRGSENDVLARYLAAAQAHDIDVIMRVTSDCPLIDPDVCAAVLALRAQECADYATNTMPNTFPHGLACEVFTFKALVESAASTQNPYDREHVTPWIRRAPHLKHANVLSDDPTLVSHRWTLDYPEDLQFFRAIYESLPNAAEARTADLLKHLALHPELSAINSCRRIM